MTVQPAVTQQRLFGEDVPAWLAWGLALLGTAGSVTVALLVMQISPAVYSGLSTTFSSGSEPAASALPPGSASFARPSPLDPQTPATAPLLPEMPAPATVSRSPDAGSRPRAIAPAERAGPREGAPEDVRQIALPQAQQAAERPASLVSAGDERSATTARDTRRSTDADPFRETDRPAKARLRSAPEAVPSPARPVEQAADRPNTAPGDPSAVLPVTRAAAPSPPEAAWERGPAADSGLPRTRAEPLDKARPLTVPRSAKSAAPGAAEPADAIEKTTEQVSETPSRSVDSDCAPLFQATFRRGSERPEAPGLEASVARLAQWLQRHPTTQVLVEGHADAMGPDEFNLLLSYRRANALAAMLERAGVPRRRLLIRAYGESQPLEQVVESALNRRVSLTIADRKDCPQALAAQGDIR